MDIAVTTKYREKSLEKNLPNSMDNILVNYGVSFTKEERRTIRFGNDPQKKEELKSKIKTCTVPEFLAIDPKSLTDSEQKIQAALRKVYEINGKEPPLYKEFPTYRSDTNPLTIDITTVGLEDEFNALYQPIDNTIEFTKISNPIALVRSIAHELKHAENHTKEVYELKKNLSDNNAYGLHQLRFLDEATAYTCAERVAYIAGDTSDDNVYKSWADMHAKRGLRWDEARVRESTIRLLLDVVYNIPSYKDRYDSGYPIGKNDAGLDHIPEVFHISEEDTIRKLWEAPRIARTAENKLKQARKNDDPNLYFETVYNTLSNGEKLNFDTKYVLGHCSDEQRQQITELKTPDGKEYILPSYLLQSIFCDGNLDTQRYLLTHTRDGKPLANIVDYIVRYVAGSYPVEVGKNFQELLNHTKITEKDVSEGYGDRGILTFVTSKKDVIDRLSRVIGLKGADGKPLVLERQLANELYCLSSDDTFKKVSAAKTLFDCVSDNNGNLLVDRKLFGSHLLSDKCFDESYLHSEEEKKEAFDLAFLYMSLKDKNGKPIISSKDIQSIPKENRTLISAIKTYKRQQAKGRLKRFLGLKQTENSETREEWKAKVKELKFEKKADRKGRSDTFKKLLAAHSKEGKKEVLREFHSQPSPAGVKRRTALKFDR